MISQILVHSREAICPMLEQLLRDQSNAFISVIDPLADNVFAAENGRAITLRFDDVSPDMFESEERFEQICKLMEGYGRPYQLFNDAQALQVVSYVRELHEAQTKVNLHVHCTLGVSRSGAIATYAAQACNLDLGMFAVLNPQIQPNKLVLEKLCNTALRGSE